jgi:periplasmic protein CpxP/Spy
MNEKACQVALHAALFVVMMAFLSAIFLVYAIPSFAASSKHKSSASAGTTAVEHTEARIKQLQGELKITEPQEKLWNNLTQVMRQNAIDMDALTKDRAENIKTMNAVEYMKFHNQITEARLAQMKKFLPPFEALYASMSDEQKKSTDTLFRTGKYGKHRKHGRK